jgi:hypothetical protein
VTVEALLLLRIGDEEILDVQLVDRVSEVAAWLERRGRSSTSVYHLSGSLFLRSGRDAVEIDDEIYGPIQRLCIGALPALAAGSTFRTSFEASSDDIAVEPDDEDLRVTVTDQDAVSFEPITLLQELLRIGTTYAEFLTRLDLEYHVPRELIAGLTDGLPAARDAVAAVFEHGWPLASAP